VSRRRRPDARHAAPARRWCRSIALAADSCGWTTGCSALSLSHLRATWSPCGDRQIAASFGGRSSSRTSRVAGSVQSRLGAASRATAKCGSTERRSPRTCAGWRGASPGIEADVSGQHVPRRSVQAARQVANRPARARDRADDVPLLASRVLDDWCAAHGRAPRTMTHAALALLAGVDVDRQRCRAASRGRTHGAGDASRRHSDRRCAALAQILSGRPRACAVRAAA